MKRLAICAVSLAALIATACVTRRDAAEPEDRMGGLSTATADIRDASGQTRARATIDQLGDGVRVRVESVTMTPDAYGIHIHAAGRCDAPGFETAGPHWNPTGRQHGKDNPLGMHRGDLPNLLVGADGRGILEYTIPDAWVSGGGRRAILDGDGAAVVIHAQPDDFRTDPSGNSGARIACGVFR